MARSRGPRNLIAHRPHSEGEVDERAHADYDAMIAHDLGGRRQTSYRAVDDGGPASAAELLLRPVTLFLLACTAFVLVLALWLWQAGVLGRLQSSLAPPPKPAPSASWMGTRQPKGVAPMDASSDALSSAPNTPTATPADAALPVDSAAATTDDAADSNAAD